MISAGDKALMEDCFPRRASLDPALSRALPTSCPHRIFSVCVCVHTRRVKRKVYMTLWHDQAASVGRPCHCESPLLLQKSVFSDHVTQV